MGQGVLQDQHRFDNDAYLRHETVPEALYRYSFYDVASVFEFMAFNFSMKRYGPL